MQVKDLNLPLKHNQLVVANFISQIREDDCYWCKELLAAENNERRKEILKMKVKRILPVVSFDGGRFPLSTCIALSCCSHSGIRHVFV